MPRIKVYFAFADFLKAHSQRTTGTYTDLGYYISDYFTKPLDSGDPEGDFSKEEIERISREAGAIPVSLGPWVLRTETAAVAAVALLNHELRLAAASAQATA